MVFNLYWTEKDIEDAESEFGTHVASRLESVLEQKAREVRWKGNTAEVARRFHNFFGLGGLHVAEIKFTVQSREFRAVCLLVAEDSIAYFDLVDKEGGGQERLLRNIRKNAEDIRDAIRERLNRASS